ncbi:Tox-REase-5 domain-containing protein [Myxococcus eversor]|uniref:Tox-REase-5 domain-containing protein n=1 Tax=Myxococcus eversor TaxID=2709661 RepID=UPI0013D7370B|nr:Tox-REase-5 domain-containing protein [Myxococcus eversor]
MRAGLWMLCAALFVTGCAGVEPSTRRGTFQQRSALLGERAPEARNHRGQRSDAFDELLRGAGLEDRDSRPVSGDSLTATQAARLLEVLLGKDVTLGQFPARVAVGFMLREVLDAGEVSRAELVRRVGRFTQLAVLRPDGCLAWVRSGQTQQRVGAVEWKDGAFRAGQFELGVFYSGKGGVFRQLSARLEETGGGAFADVHDDADYLSRTLDGAEEAFVGLAMAVGQIFATSPADNLAALGQMPAAVAALLASSPEYLERFQYMPRGEQVQAVSKLVTNLIATWGTAAAATRTLQGATLATAEVPILSLSAQGAFVMGRVAVPVGRAAAVLSGGPGAAIILQRVGTRTTSASPAKGPGQWGPVKESMSPRARRYQEQITGHSADDAYWVGGMSTQAGGVKFDGVKDGVLLEAKGPGYDKFFDDLDPKAWFRHSGAKSLADQAERQSMMVRGMGIPIEWHVAESRAAEAISLLLERRSIKGIKVIYTPAR